MALNSINRLRHLRLLLTGIRRHWLQWRTGIVIDPSCSISLSSRFLPGMAGGISVGADTLVAFKTLIDARDLATGTVRPIRIGARCFIGGGSMILPGVTVEDEAIVAAGAVVAEDVPARCIVAGNPAKIIRREIEVGRFGRLKSADANIARFLEAQQRAG
jgi:acetyltransferase-like isoleucine patch superfamily enzyme